MVTVKEITYKNFGRCVEVSNGTIDFVATLDIGPRIIRFGLVGKENEFFEDTDDKINQLGNKDFEVFGNRGVWHIYGGHRLWTSPEAMPRSYYPENAPVEYQQIENGIRLKPSEQTWTQIKMEIELTMCDSHNCVEVVHKITNTGCWTVEFAAWALSVLAQGGIEVIPQPTCDTGLLANRMLAIWAYTKMNDKRVYWGDKYITLRQDVNAECPFKLGINSEHGWAAYFNHGNMLVKHFPTDGTNYPDGGMSFETYTNQHFLEMESLGELKLVQSGQTITHKEKWQIFGDVAAPSNNETEIDEIVKKYIG